MRLQEDKNNYLANERGVAALMGIIFALIILGSIAFNFVTEMRQKQSGSSMTYTSTHALMIAEAGLRYTQKCLTQSEPTGETWGCPTGIYENTDWTTIPPANLGDPASLDDFNKDFAEDGNFSIVFPYNASNDAINIFVVSTGTFKGAQRSLSRFISRACVFGENSITTCVGTMSANNATVDPPGEEESGVCPAGGMVPALDPVPSACDADCNANPLPTCPDFNPASHLDGLDFLTQFTFCDMDVDGIEIKTKDADVADDLITVAGDLTLAGTTTMSLSDDAVDPATADDTVINVYGDVEIKNTTELNVNGSVTINTGGTFTMENSSKLNNIQGDPADASVWVEGDATIQNTAMLTGSLSSDGTITLGNNSEVNGALSGNEVVLTNNTTLIYSSSAGSNTVGIAQCTAGSVAPNWSE